MCDLYSQGKPDEIYYYRDKDGREVDFIIPEGSLLNLYEAKWQDDSGTIRKILKIFGEENIKEICTLTTALKNTKMSHFFG